MNSWQSNEGATADDWRQLFESHIHRIEDEANQANHDDPKQNESQDDQAKLAEEQEELFQTTDHFPLGKQLFKKYFFWKCQTPLW